MLVLTLSPADDAAYVFVPASPHGQTIEIRFLQQRSGGAQLGFVADPSVRIIRGLVLRHEAERSKRSAEDRKAANA